MVRLEGSLSLTLPFKVIFIKSFALLVKQKSRMLNRSVSGSYNPRWGETGRVPIRVCLSVYGNLLSGKRLGSLRSRREERTDFEVPISFLSCLKIVLETRWVVLSFGPEAPNSRSATVNVRLRGSYETTSCLSSYVVLPVGPPTEKRDVKTQTRPRSNGTFQPMSCPILVSQESGGVTGYPMKVPSRLDQIRFVGEE